MTSRSTQASLGWAFGWSSAFSAAINALDLYGPGFSRAARRNFAASRDFAVGWRFAVCRGFVEEPGFSRASAAREEAALAAGGAF
jgi:hypothetical protein